MCLIAFSVAAHPSYPLVVIANRDEAYARPTEPAHAWGEGGIFGGRDVLQGGTWLGVTSSGRFATVTNVRSPNARRDGASRGALVRGALGREGDVGAFWAALGRERYPAFNLLFGDAECLFYASEESAVPARISPGTHALSNARLDAAWPKAEKAKRRLRAILAADGAGEGGFDVAAGFMILEDREQAPDEALPRTGVPIELERALSPAFIAMDSYGTRASTVVLFHVDGSVRFAERSFGPGGVLLQEVDVTLARG